VYVPPVEWEIAAYEGEGGWRWLGRADGSNPQAALDSWAQENGDLHDLYGVRSPGQTEWERFGHDADARLVPFEVFE
jgi:hypothetical protein